jgi:plasmid stabilization system protein ParE
VQVRYLTPARDEFLAALEFYEREAPGLGADFDAEVREVGSRLVEYPNIGSPFGDGTRRVLLQGFPFSLIYEVAASEILVVAVAHHRRRPNYWRDRLG